MVRGGSEQVMQLYQTHNPMCHCGTIVIKKISFLGTLLLRIASPTAGWLQYIRAAWMPRPPPSSPKLRNSCEWGHAHANDFYYIVTNRF